MITNDATLLKLKHEVNQRVCKLAFEGKFEEDKDFIAYEMIPGPKAQYRCCIYKEREVIRQRVNLASGKTPLGEAIPKSEKPPIVYIIPSACEECPISRYTVTSNCQNCIGKACYNSCKFGAITIGMHQAHIDPQKCKECGKCSQACPYNAIADLKRPCRKACPVDALKVDTELGIAKIDYDKCISCGHCIHNCPFGAIGSVTELVDVVEAIRSGKNVYAMVAPAVEGQFGPNMTMESIRQATIKAGFKDMIEVGLGGDLTAAAEAAEWAEAYKEGKKMTTSCCPAFVAMIEKHYPKLMDNVSTTVSPMTAISRMLKAKDPDCVTIFIGPCVAKKNEAMNFNIEGSADYVLTMSEMLDLMAAKGIELEEAENTYQDSTVYGKRFGNSGGVTAAVVQSFKELGEDIAPTVEVCNGAAECKKALLMMNAGRLKADFIEGMICEGGCVGGPSRFKSVIETRKDRDKLIASAEDRLILKNIDDLVEVDSFSMHRK